MTQLTSHMKMCHSRTNEVKNGNAITINSPLLTTNHFFCNCAICGNGFDNYSQLSLHERESHYFKCEECDENFMIQNDLDSHYSSKHQSTFHCNVCSEIFNTKEHLGEHMLTLHKSGQEISCQTDELSCNTCDANIRQKELMNTLEREHLKLKEEHAQFKSLYFYNHQRLLTSIREMSN